LNRDQVLGVVILVIGILGLAVYGWFIYTASTITLQITAFVAVVNSGILVQGPKTSELEQRFAVTCGTKYAIATSSERRRCTWRS
jgi:hypothetical protein